MTPAELATPSAILFAAFVIGFFMPGPSSVYNLLVVLREIRDHLREIRDESRQENQRRRLSP